MNSDGVSSFNAHRISEWFWDIIRRADKSKLKLRAILEGFTQAEIYKFQDEFLEARAELTDDTFVTYIDPDESEDGVTDIANWVVSQGKEYFEEVLEDPQKIPSQVEIDNPEILFGVAEDIYEERFGETLGLM
jgi:hypothetical protein